MTLSFAAPWIFLLLPLPALVWWLIPPYQERTNALRIPFFRSIAQATDASVSSGATVLSRPAWSMAVGALCWCLILSALARPERLGDPVTLTSSARDLVLAVDISGSMDDRDMAGPDGSPVQRLAAVKDVVRSFVTEREGDRVGLIVFGARAFIQTPFTEDLESVADLLDQTQPGMAGPNTAIGDAIGLAIRSFETSDIEDERVLILLSDGADTASTMSPINAAEIAAQNGITIYTIGVGNPDASGEDRLDPKTLEDIAMRTGGSFYFGTDVEGLSEIYAELDARNPRVTDSQTYTPKTPLAHLPLSIALLLGLGATGVLHLTQRRKGLA